MASSQRGFQGQPEGQGAREVDLALSGSSFLVCVSACSRCFADARASWQNATGLNCLDVAVQFAGLHAIARLICLMRLSS